MKKISVLIFLFLIVFSTIKCSDLEKQTLVIGHRGAMGYKTENTLASIQKAMDMGVDMIEIDVFKIKSGEIVVFHDDEVDRLTDGKGLVEDMTIEEVKELRLSGGHKIPTLIEVLDLMAAKTKLNVELKGANTAKNVNIILHNYITNEKWENKDFIISSFNWEELRAFYAINKDIAIGILTEEEPMDAIEIGEELNAVAIHPDFSTLTQEKVEKIQGEGFKIYTWTVNETTDIEKMKSFGVEGIITNFPDRVRSTATH
ncbi:glycerophosphodiester phosphodiesterase [Flavobacteriaceae bacterium R38]|nr:glycerophosphodiester phosphodiesterase [Flavobacteriaceae bacterium R38]